ncbi:MAG TPA: glycosyltransferase family 87 protein [Candidatus Eisenbacteria bacterium]|nr:glycosyltransferase family 87 protein [Candidatus Eisenbacteria bacterium]
MTLDLARGATHAHRAVGALPVLAVAVLCASYVAMGASNQWDFETYYYAGLAARSGADPYSLDDLSQLAGRQIELPYLYPPFTLAIFYPFTYLPPADAARLWLVLQSALVFLLIRIWSRQYAPRVPVGWLIVVTLLGFNAAALWGLRTGNVVLVEVALLWLGFSAYARGKLIPAALLISLAGAFKLLPLAFLSIIALGPDRTVRKVAAIGAGAAVLALLLLATGDLTSRWASALAAAHLWSTPAGEINPSTPAVIGSILSIGGLAEPGSRAVQTAYAVVAVIVLTFSWRPLQMLVTTGSRHGVVALGSLVWLILSPRVMVYTFLLAVAPSLYTIWTWMSSELKRRVACVVLVSHGFIRFLPGPPPAFLSIAPLILTAAI